MSLLFGEENITNYNAFEKSNYLYMWHSNIANFESYVFIFIHLYGLN